MEYKGRTKSKTRKSQEIRKEIELILKNLGNE
jgi:hypothetical protein